MAIKLTTDQVVNAVLAFMLQLLAVLLATGCAAVDNRDAEFALLNSQLAAVKLQMAAMIDESASPTTTAGDVGGDLTVITLAGATPWTIAGLVGLLGLFQARRRSTTTGALDRVMGVVKSRHHAAIVN